MEPGPPDKTPSTKSDSPPLPAPKSYVTPKLTEHGKLPPLTLGGSGADATDS